MSELLGKVVVVTQMKKIPTACAYCKYYENMGGNRGRGMAVGDEYLASVRHSVRLSSTVHDGELTDLINAARADLVLGGVLEAKANDETDPLIKKAVTTYVKAEFGLDNEDADRLRASYKEQRNGLSLSDSYIAAEGG